MAYGIGTPRRGCDGGPAAVNPVSASVLQTVLAALDCAVVVLDADGRAILANRPACDLFGPPGSDLIGGALSSIARERGGGGAALAAAVRAATEAGLGIRLADVPLRGRRLAVRAEPLGPGRRAGARSGAVVVAADRTERRDLRDAVRTASRLVGLGSVAAGLAHEISNPITAILGYAHFLTAAPLSAKARADLDHIIEEAERCERIVRGVLAMTRDQAPSVAPIDVGALIRETSSLASMGLRRAGIEVREHLDPDSGPVLADRQLLQQVLLNLIGNAVQAMGAVGGRLTLAAERHDDTVCVTVTDTGPGIAAKDLPRIFDPLFTTRGASGGAGLGLDLCRRIVERHGGTRMTVTLPSAPAAESEAPADRAFNRA